MRNAFTTVFPVVDDHPKTVLLQSFLFRHFSDCEQKVTEESLVVWLDVSNPGNNLLRDDQKVMRGLRIDVSHRNAEIVFVNEFGGYFPRNDFFENSAHGKRCEVIWRSIFEARKGESFRWRLRP